MPLVPVPNALWNLRSRSAGTSPSRWEQRMEVESRIQSSRYPGSNGMMHLEANGEHWCELPCSVETADSSKSGPGGLPAALFSGGTGCLDREREQLVEEQQRQVEDLVVSDLDVLRLLQPVGALEQHRNAAADVVEGAGQVEGGRRIGLPV